MSILMCKFLQRVILPVDIQVMKNSKDNPFHTLPVGKHPYRPCPSPYFSESTLYGIGRPNLLPQLIFFDMEKGQQILYIRFQTFDRIRIDAAPTSPCPPRGGGQGEVAQYAFVASLLFFA